jgi:hypothetical protein
MEWKLIPLLDSKLIPLVDSKIQDCEAKRKNQRIGNMAMLLQGWCGNTITFDQALPCRNCNDLSELPKLHIIQA